MNFGIVFAVLVAGFAVGDAATYTVGDSLGWTIPNPPSAYSTWASRHVFRTGDVLVFNFATGAHDVARVTKAAHDGCSSNSPISLSTVGPTNITLDSAGETYFICTFGQHCSLGQKLAINVSGASSPSPSPTPATPPPAPAPAPRTTPTPAPAPTPTPTPTPAPAPTPTGGPSPSPSPAGGPSPSPSPTPTPSQESSPSPAPGGAATPPSPPPPPPPGSPPATPPGAESPPPPGGLAPKTDIANSLIIFASIVIGLVV